MYLGTESPLKTLETIIWGYETALWVNGVVEGVPHMNRHFLDWLDSRSRQRWSCARGFAAVIEEHTPPGVTPLQFFFELIDKYQPLLALHGHVHEGKGTRKYKRTLCINPGSMYEQGMLHGAVVELKADKIGNYVLTTG